MRIGILQFEKRQAVPLYKKIVNPIVFVFLGLAFSSVFIFACGFQPIPVFAKMISYSFLNEQGITSSINAALPLMFCGLSVAIAFKMNLSNIGGGGAVRNRRTCRRGICSVWSGSACNVFDYCHVYILCSGRRSVGIDRSGLKGLLEDQ